ncbi:helix-turn-helix domain-containing protein [Solimonas sp. K1W22B-7]|uniref:helix-turn-helix domain-containing protein n=1 Tax=Solimonas sp. K1W22B-7 TaxID=2303331 RepID=UPI000E331CE3|nr:helix-turn-helix domain-containing protein [Solimonas sp. K1W22B-7]AXQ27484.1 helix-turn-helix domain-containing protein [Solimonas sp. K1W22B-7]
MDYVARTPEQLGQLLRSCRAQRGITQSLAGAKVGLKQSTVSGIELDASRSSVETLYKLLSSLDLELVLRDKQARTPGRSQREW